MKFYSTDMNVHAKECSTDVASMGYQETVCFSEVISLGDLYLLI
jgi:hypothetical protein